MATVPCAMSTKELVAVRLEPEIVARIDALKDYFSAEWRDATRSDVIRALILDSLERFEKAHEAARAKPDKASPKNRKRPKPRGK